MNNDRIIEILSTKIIQPGHLIVDMPEKESKNHNGMVLDVQGAKDMGMCLGHAEWDYDEIPGVPKEKYPRVGSTVYFPRHGKKTITVEGVKITMVPIWDIVLWENPD